MYAVTVAGKSLLTSNFAMPPATNSGARVTSRAGGT